MGSTNENRRALERSCFGMKPPFHSESRCRHSPHAGCDAMATNRDLDRPHTRSAAYPAAEMKTLPNHR